MTGQSYGIAESFGKEPNIKIPLSIVDELRWCLSGSVDSILRLKPICTVYHLCEMASVIERKDMLLQRLRERLAQEDLELIDLQDTGQDALFTILGSLGLNPIWGRAFDEAVMFELHFAPSIR